MIEDEEFYADWKIFSDERQWGFKGIPRMPTAGIEEIRWLGSDNYPTFRKNNSKNWTIDSVSYKFNSHGYRSAEMIKSEKFTIACFGCSTTLGIGVPVEETWPQLFLQKFKAKTNKDAEVLNFAWSAVSSDFISRTMYSVLPVIEPDLVLILLPTMHRYELYNDDGSTTNAFPQNEYCRQFYEIYDNEYWAKNNFLKNFNFIEMMINRYNIPWIFSTWNPETRPLIETHENYVLYKRNHRDTLARDGRHAAFLTFNDFSDLLLSKYFQLY